MLTTNKGQEIFDTKMTAKPKFLFNSSIFLVFTFLSIFIIGIYPLKAQSDPPLDSKLSLVGNSGFITVEIPDSTNISQIEVEILGNNSSSVFSNVYNFDQMSGLASGMSYGRIRNTITLGTGTLSLPLIFQSKVRLKDISGNWSSWYEYTSN